MRIHFFVRTIHELGAGAHQNSISFIRYLSSTGNDVRVHTFTSHNNKPPHDITIIDHSCNNLTFLEEQEKLIQILKENENAADVYFLYGVDFTWGGGKYRNMGGLVPVAVYVDTYLASMGLGAGLGWMYRYKRYIWDKLRGVALAQFVDLFCAVSPFVKERYEKFGFPSNKITVVPNFFVLEKPFKPTIYKKNIQFIYTGRITYDKGVDLLIRAVAGLVNIPHWNLKIIGAGAFQPQCLTLIKEFNLASRVQIFPWVSVDKLQQEYKNSDVFIHPARWPEPFGRTLVEAMAQGLPMIVPQYGAPPWIVQDAALYFQSGDMLGLRKAIEQILFEPNLRESLGDKAIQRSKEFSTEKIGPILEKALKKICVSK